MRRLLATSTLVLLGALIGLAPASAAQAATTNRPTVVVVAVPGLLWKDVAAMPATAALSARSSVGELVVKTRGGITRCAAGLLAVSAGNRTESPTSTCAIDMSTWPQLRAGNRASRYDARIGALGTALQGAGISTTAVGKTAVPMLANTDGTVDSVTGSVANAVKAGGVIGVVDSRLYNVIAVNRPAARVAVDARIAAIEKAVPSNAILVVAGVSDLGGGHAQLHTLLISGPGWPHTELRSSKAGRAPFVETIDIAPTLLTMEGVKTPSFMVGRSMQQTSGTVPPISTYIQDDFHAIAQRTLGQRVFLTLGILAIVMMVFAASPWRALRSAARWIARLLAPAPALVFLANALPWWHWPQAVYGLIVLGGCVVLGAATTFAARRNFTAALLVVPIFSFAILAIDQLTGASLQLSAPLGDSPLIAGRFSGMGNLDFAVMGTSALIVAGVVGARLPRRKAVAVSAVVVLVAVVVDGAPPLGNDIGGVLTLLPSSIVLVALVAQVKLTKRRVAGVVLATVAVAVLLALADYSRPAASQTDVGRFVGQVLHGGAGTEVRRKFDAAVASIGLTIGTFVALIALVLGIACRGRLQGALARSPGARAAAIAATVLGLLGMALNDSGITIAAMAAIVAASALYGAGLTASPTGATPADSTPAGPAPAGGTLTGEPVPVA